MQDAIYNQVQWAQNIANTPYQAYELPTVAELSPLQQQAYQKVQDNQGFYSQPLLDTQNTMSGLSTSETATNLGLNQADYLDSARVKTGLDNAETNWEKASGLSPLTNAATNFSSAEGYSPTANAMTSLTNSGTSAADITTNANPYLTSASKNAYTDVSNYMNPYQTNVMDVMAQQSGRNLRENILPQVSDSFTKAGQFGSSRMGEFGSRAVRDTQQSLQQLPQPL
jgi:hypothetical protein